MASITIGPSTESISLPNAHLQDKEFSDSLDPNQSAMMVETASRQLSPSRAMPKSPLRNGVPPKRLSMTAKRTAPATASASSRSNPPPASQTVSGTGLSKPPTRPLVSSAVRRPATSVTAATAASTGHRKRPSIASNEINSTKRGDLSVTEENIKPTSGKPEARRNAYDKGDIKNAMQISNADKLYSATKAEHGAASGRTGNISPTKLVLRSTTNNSRPSNLHNTPRGTRPTASSTGGLAKAETTKKRLSTIPASPAPKNPDSSILDSTIAPAISKGTRPALHNRKSTMSVTNEQRLREIDLVHQMLRVAAQDGDDDGRKFDESLASLRSRLEETHRNERIEPPERENSKGSSEQSSGVVAKQATSGDDKLLGALHKSEFKVLAPDDEISDLQRCLQQRISGIENDTEVSSQDGASIDASESLREEIQKIREMQALEIIELSEKHQILLAAAQAKTDEAESRYQEAMGRLESAVESGAAAKTLSEEREFEISRLRTVQSDQRKWLADAQQRLDEQAGLLEKKEDTILEKDREIVELCSEMQEFRTQQDSQIEEVEKASLEQLQQMDDELAVVHHDHQSVIASHTKELEDKDEEIKVLAQVIEGFQTQMQSIHEQKEREVNEAKLDFIEKHEKELENVVSDLRRQHTADVADVEFSNRRQLQVLQAEHEDALESVRVNHASEVKRLDKSLWESDVKNETMEQEISNRKAITEKLEVEIASLKQEKVELGADFKHASDEAVGLRKTLETLGYDTEDKDKQYATALKKLEEELAETTKALEERAAERDTSLKRHVEELDSLHSLHDVNVQTLESESRAALLEMQTRHDKLLAQLSQIEREYGEELGALKSEHAETLEKRAKDLEHLIMTHATETQDKLDQAERTHQDEIKALLRSTDQKYKILCKKMNTATEQLQQHQESRDIQAGRCEELVNVVESLKSELATSQDELSHANSEIARLTTDIEETRKTLQDTTETDHLRYEMFELTRQHAAETARMQETLDVENDKRAKERKQGAEVRDRLVNETEKLANDLSATKLEVDKFRTELHVAKTELQAEVKKNDAHRQATESAQASHQEIVDDLEEARALIEKLNGEVSRKRDQEESFNSKLQKIVYDLKEARTAIKRLESEMSQQRDEQESSDFNHQKTADDLKEARAAIVKLKSEMSKQRDEEESSSFNEELEALQFAADAEREQNTKLREQIREATVVAEQQATKLREAQAALKVTSAELTELRTIKPNGSQFSASPAPKSDLRSSRWATPEKAVDKKDIVRAENDADEDLGSTISGNMAGMQEQIRQMEEFNSEMMEEELRIVDRISLVCPPTSPISEYDPTTAGISTRIVNGEYEYVCDYVL